jgi:hypothetical protein
MKQGGHIWYEDMRGTLSELGYTHVTAGSWHQLGQLVEHNGKGDVPAQGAGQA